MLGSIGILIDTREKVNKNITNWLDQKHIPYKKKKLDNCDYSFYIPADQQLNIERELRFDKEIAIERKASLDELAGNLTQHRTRFEEEMATFNGKKYLLIENSTYNDIINGNYRSDYSPKSYLATLHAFNHRYNLEVVFMPDSSQSALWIYSTFIYWLREKIK